MGWGALLCRGLARLVTAVPTIVPGLGPHASPVYSGWREVGASPCFHTSLTGPQN